MLRRFDPLVDSFTTSLQFRPRRDSQGTASRQASPECPGNLVPGRYDHSQHSGIGVCIPGSVPSSAQKRAPIGIEFTASPMAQTATSPPEVVRGQGRNLKGLCLLLLDSLDDLGAEAAPHTMPLDELPDREILSSSLTWRSQAVQNPEPGLLKIRELQNRFGCPFSLALYHRHGRQSPWQTT